jgi:hypothetical protein
MMFSLSNPGSGGARLLVAVAMKEAIPEPKTSLTLSENPLKTV